MVTGDIFALVLYSLEHECMKHVLKAPTNETSLSVAISDELSVMILMPYRDTNGCIIY